MLQEQRYDLILKFLKETGSLSMQELIERLNVSRETVRRDLRDMEEKGLLTKVHGGAVLNRVGEEPPYAVRTTAHQQEKQGIAAAALALVDDGDTLFIDSGTTALAFAHTLIAKRNLTVFTHSLPVAVALSEYNVRVYLCGGMLRPGELALSGVIANRIAENLYVDKAFLSADGVSLEHGVTYFHLEEAELRRLILDKASKVIVLTDHSKFGVTAFVKTASLNDIDYLVTDNHLSNQAVTQLTEAGVRVIQA
ncbi:DeoR/GlpR family DNA-binding transcription regulator [Alicyclobacillus fodiniaquatilis]|uniref:Lactose phosphotransferase system repressor n=1 Tax=Alicyclobacillus fodiniaquatilis TaxID=1661150 RepID=A0ABW4JAW8_9BACL